MEWIEWQVGEVITAIAPVGKQIAPVVVGNSASVRIKPGQADRFELQSLYLPLAATARRATRTPIITASAHTSCRCFHGYLSLKMRGRHSREQICPGRRRTDTPCSLEVAARESPCIWRRLVICRLRDQRQSEATWQADDLTLAVQTQSRSDRYIGGTSLSDHQAFNYTIATGFAQPGLACKHCLLVRLQIFSRKQTTIKVMGSMQPIKLAGEVCSDKLTVRHLDTSYPTACGTRT